MPPTLAPNGVAGSLIILPLVHGSTRDALLDPSLVRLPDGQVSAEWARPQDHLCDAELGSMIKELYDRGLIRMVAEAELRKCKGDPLTVDLFGVPKPTAPDKQVGVGGVRRDKQRLICHVVPSDCLQERREGDVDTLPYSGQADSTLFLGYDLFTGRKRDRLFRFYVYCLPDAWAG